MKKILKIFKYIFVKIYFSISTVIQNIFRTVYRQDMYLAQLNVVSKVHEKTFGNYKNYYNGKDIVIIATGPSLNNYQPIDNVVNIAVNSAFKYDKVNFDYLFAIDYSATRLYLDELINYPQIKKFYGIVPKTPFGFKEEPSGLATIPESTIIEHNADKFFIYSKRPAHPVDFNVDIDKTWLVDGGSCVFSAVQFALFTNPKKIYIVGCDCTIGHFNEKTSNKIKKNKKLVKTWLEVKKFANTYYPNTEIISVNPVGLKGIFTDLIQNENMV